MNRLASPSQLRASLIRWAVFIVPLVSLLGYVSSLVSGSSEDNVWFAMLNKPAIYPPGYVFGIVWPVLYVLMGLAFAGICSAWGSRMRPWAIAVFVVQLALNLAWSPVFFASHQIGLAMGVLMALVVLVMVCIWLFWPIRRWAALLLLPYLAWIMFASVLNWQFLQMNPDASTLEPSTSTTRIEL